MNKEIEREKKKERTDERKSQTENENDVNLFTGYKKGVAVEQKYEKEMKSCG